MKIPDDAIIPDEKLTRYLLVHRAKSDKSAFLARAGFTQENPEQLKAAIQQLAAEGEGVESRTDQYGTYYQVEGTLLGEGSVALLVTTIWLQRQLDGKFQFITLIPRKEQK